MSKEINKVKKEELINELVKNAKKKKTVTYYEIFDYLSDLDLDKDEIDDVFQTFTKNEIAVLQYAESDDPDAEPDDSEIISMEDGASGSGTDDVIDEKDENANSDDYFRSFGRLLSNPK